MANLKPRGAANSNDKSGDVARLKTSSLATMDELRDFLGNIRGKSPQEIMGFVAESELIRGVIASTVVTVIGLVIFTVGPYMVYGPKQAKKTEPASAAQPAEPAAEKSTAPAGDANAESAGKSKEEAVKKMTAEFDEVKGAKSNEAPKNVDTILDELE